MNSVNRETLRIVERTLPLIERSQRSKAEVEARIATSRQAAFESFIILHGFGEPAAHRATEGEKGGLSDHESRLLQEQPE